MTFSGNSCYDLAIREHIYPPCYCQCLWQNDAWRSQQGGTLYNDLVECIQPGQARDYSVHYLTPGFSDNHIHGGDGFCIMEANESGL